MTNEDRLTFIGSMKPNSIGCNDGHKFIKICDDETSVYDLTEMGIDYINSVAEFKSLFPKAWEDE